MPISLFAPRYSSNFVNGAVPADANSDSQVDWLLRNNLTAGLEKFNFNTNSQYPASNTYSSVNHRGIYPTDNNYGAKKGTPGSPLPGIMENTTQCVTDAYTSIGTFNTNAGSLTTTQTADMVANNAQLLKRISNLSKQINKDIKVLIGYTVANGYSVATSMPKTLPGYFSTAVANKVVTYPSAYNRIIPITA